MSLCHTKLSYEFCSLQKKTLNNVTTPRFALIFLPKVQHFGMPLRMCPKHLNLDTSNNETKAPIISTCPNALAHILGTTSLLPSQSTANFTDWFAYRFDSWRSYLGSKSCVNSRVHTPVLLVACFQHFNNTLGNQTLKPNVLLCQPLKRRKEGEAVQSQTKQTRCEIQKCQQEVALPL